MRQILTGLSILILLNSCGSKGGGASSTLKETRGEIKPKTSSQKFAPETPYGMVPIPSGSFVMGNADLDFTSQKNAPLKTVSVSSFFMDETEVTNADYRFFVNYVRDSIARTLLAEKAGEGTGEEGGRGESISDYAYKNASANQEDLSPYQQYLLSLDDERSENNVSKQLDWSVPLYWSTSEYPDVTYAEVMESLYYKPEDRYNNERQLDPRNFVYHYSWIDNEGASKGKGKRSEYVHTENVMIYPDTACWTKDFAYSYNEPMQEEYFWHSAFDNYPVVGVNWTQAKAYCVFKTNYKIQYNNTLKKKKQRIFPFRLPTEAEWEYAARGGLQDGSYPWGGPYLSDDRGCYLANFKPRRGDYMEKEPSDGNRRNQGYLYTAKVKTFHANGYGLYDMAGNVSEWTQTPFNNAAYNTTSTINPYLGRGDNSPKKVIRGGSWKDVGYLLMVSARDWEHKDSARSFVGFRTIQNIPENSQVKYKHN